MLKIKYNQIKFDAASFLAKFKQAYAEEIADITNWLEQQAMSMAPVEVDRLKIQSEVVEIGNELLGKVSAGGMGALITEWGSGSEMDLSNEGLYDYIGGPYWNPARPDTTIVGRPEGAYVDLDGEVHYSHGRWEGKDLEKGIYKRNGELIFKAEPHGAEHWLRNLIELSKPTVIQRLVAVMERFEIHKFLG